MLELTDFTPEGSVSPEKTALSVGRKVCHGFWWFLTGTAWLGSEVAPSAFRGTWDWALLGPFGPNQYGQCQALVASTGQPASTGSLDNLVGKHQLTPERELRARQHNCSCWKAVEGISSLQENRKSKC